MNPMMPALASFTLTIGVVLTLYAFGRLRAKDDPWARMEQERPSRRTAGEPDKKSRQSPLSKSLNKRMAGSGYAEKTAQQLSQADVRLTPAEFLMARVAAAAVGAMFGTLLARYMGLPPILGALPMALVGYKVPPLIVGLKRRQRVNAFNAQLADSTMMLANSLRAGYSLLQSMDLMSKDAPQPTATEFRRVVQEVGVGLTLSQALGNMLRRVPSADLDLLITAIGIQQEVGGNLSQVLEGISNTIRERVRIKGEIRVLTSQGRYSGYLITAMPFLVAVAVNLMNPEYMKPLWTFPWIFMPIVSLIMIGFAYLIIRKIVNIEV